MQAVTPLIQRLAAAGVLALAFIVMASIIRPTAIPAEDASPTGSAPVATDADARTTSSTSAHTPDTARETPANPEAPRRPHMGEASGWQPGVLDPAGRNDSTKADPPSLGQLEGREFILHVFAGSNGPLFTIVRRDGARYGVLLSADEAAMHFPDGEIRDLIAAWDTGLSAAVDPDSQQPD